MHLNLCQSWIIKRQFEKFPYRLGKIFNSWRSIETVSVEPKRVKIYINNQYFPLAPVYYSSNFFHFKHLQLYFKMIMLRLVSQMHLLQGQLASLQLNGHHKSKQKCDLLCSVLHAMEKWRHVYRSVEVLDINVHRGAKI